MSHKSLGLLAASALLATTLLGPVAPARVAHAKTITVYLVAGITTDAFYRTMKRGAQTEAAKYGYKFVFTGSPTAFSAPAQIPFLNAAIANKPDFILIAPTDHIALIDPLMRATAKGIHVITVDTHTDKDAQFAITGISSDNIVGGQTSAKALAALIHNQGVVAGVNVQPGVSTTDQRQQGFEAVIKTIPGIKYIGTQFDNDDATKASNVTTAFLAAHKDLKGIFAMNEVSGDGVHTALDEATKSGQIKKGQVKLVEFDAGPEQVVKLKQGLIDALVAQDPFDIGKTAVDMAHQFLMNGGKKTGIPMHIGTGEFTITQANVNTAAAMKFEYRP
jgi:ribose transport system substrate-binding protein